MMKPVLCKRCGIELYRIHPLRRTRVRQYHRECYSDHVRETRQEYQRAYMKTYQQVKRKEAKVTA